MRWAKKHPWWTALIFVVAALIIAATVFLVIHFREAIFSENTLAIVVFSSIGVAIVIIGIMIRRALK